MKWFIRMVCAIACVIGTSAGQDKNDSRTWKLDFFDEFSGTAKSRISDAKWRYNQWNPGTVNQEAQKYTNRTENVFQDGNGNLVLRGLRDFWNGYEYTSGRIDTQGKYQWKSCVRIECRAKLPPVAGAWPGIWTMGLENTSAWGGWPGCGEVDIEERKGNWTDQIQANTFTRNYSPATGDMAEKYYRFGADELPHETFHVYSCDWYEDRVEFYVDGEKFGQTPPYMQPSPFNGNQHYFIIQNALGGTFGGAINNTKFPMDMTVDWVRIYSMTGTGPVPDQVTGVERNSLSLTRPVIGLTADYDPIRLFSLNGCLINGKGADLRIVSGVPALIINSRSNVIVKPRTPEQSR